MTIIGLLELISCDTYRIVTCSVLPAVESIGTGSVWSNIIHGVRRLYITCAQRRKCGDTGMATLWLPKTFCDDNGYQHSYCDMLL